MSLQTIKKNHLLYLSFIIYLLTLMLLLSELDRQYYQTEKKRIINDNWGILFPFNPRDLGELSEDIIVQYNQTRLIDPLQEAQWKQMTEALVFNESCVFQITLVPRDYSAILTQTNDEKFKRLNRFANVLFYRNFKNIATRPVYDSAGIARIGKITFYMTTPENFGPIVVLTKRFKLWALLIFVAATTCYSYLVRYLILPTKRVVNQINAASSASSKIIKKPSTLLEKAYNNLARDALLLRIRQAIRDMIRENPRISRTQILERMPSLLVDLLDYEAVLVFELLKTDSSDFSVSNYFEATSSAGSLDYKEYCLKNVFVLEKMKSLTEKRPVDFQQCVVSSLTEWDKGSTSAFLVVFLSREVAKLDEEGRQWHVKTIDYLAELIRADLESLELHKRYIFTEKSKANINLAKNLGHDLTNIIATSKLDIVTIMKVLDLPQHERRESPEKEQLLIDAVTGLLNNTRFLQEIVNIYRSFSYISRPQFEEVDINTVLDDIIDLFLLSISKNISVTKRYASNLPKCNVEPRLLKLAVFNILTNAVDAMKQKKDIDDGGDAICVSTHVVAETDEVCISIRDNGIGIRNIEGELATQAEIDQIFYHGFSTKKEDGGEGLGLNWVWTIIDEFHNGRIKTQNHPEGGAEFSLYLKSVSG